MQIIQIMHGIQVCPISVKVSWAKLFPEDVHDDGGEELEEGGELFPVQIALKQAPPLPSKENKNKSLSQSNKTRALSLSSESGVQAAIDPWEEIVLGQAKSPVMVDGESESSQASGHKKRSSHVDSSSKTSPLLNGISTMSPRTAGSLLKSVSSSSLLQERNDVDAMNISQGSTDSHELFTGASELGYMSSLNKVKSTDLIKKPKFLTPLVSTYLQPPIDKPANVRKMPKRQKFIEKLNAQNISPQMAVFLASTRNSETVKTTAKSSTYTENIHRTIPVNWCQAGGSDTHRRNPVAVELHHEISNKLKQSKSEYSKVTVDFYKAKVEDSKKLESEMNKLLSSGPTTISRFSLDLMRQQRSNFARGAAGTKEVPTNDSLEEVDMEQMAILADYDDDEVEKFLAEL